VYFSFLATLYQTCQYFRSPTCMADFFLCVSLCVCLYILLCIRVRAIMSVCVSAHMLPLHGFPSWWQAFFLAVPKLIHFHVMVSLTDSVDVLCNYQCTMQIDLICVFRL